MAGGCAGRGTVCSSGAVTLASGSAGAATIRQPVRAGGGRAARAGPGAAQQTPAQQAAAHQPSAVLRSSSDLVRIDVEVTDKSGKPIKGLTANQFTMTDEGKPQTITSFSYADIEAIETATADGRQADRRVG